MVWLSLLRRFWPLIAGAGALLGLWLWIAAELRQAHQEGYQQARAEAALEIERLRQHQREIDEEVQREHQAKVNELEGRVARLLRRPTAIRMCEPTGVQDGANTGEPAGSAGTGHAVQAGRDLQPELVLYGRDCAKLQQQIRDIKRRQNMR